MATCTHAAGLPNMDVSPKHGSVPPNMAGALLGRAGVAAGRGARRRRARHRRLLALAPRTRPPSAAVRTALV
eukprot:1119105-Prymnesium_polylepis.1